MKILRKALKPRIIIPQSQYIDTILTHHAFNYCHTLSIPLEPGGQLVHNTTTGHPDDQTVYRRILGSIMYLMLCTQPALAFAPAKLRKFSCTHSLEHRKALKPPLQYISKTKDPGLHFGSFAIIRQPILYMLSDADWARDKDYLRSTGAYVCTILDGGGNILDAAISWSSWQQATVALSSMDAKYMAPAQQCKEAFWMPQFIGKILTITRNNTPGGITAITIFTEITKAAFFEPKILNSKVEQSISTLYNPSSHGRLRWNKYNSNTWPPVRC